MVIFSIVLFAVAALTGVISIGIYRGNTDLIHDYHQTKVTDKAAYGKAFGKAMSLIPVTLLISGCLGLLGDTGIFPILAVLVLVMGLLIGIGCIIAVQKKHNNGVF